MDAERRKSVRIKKFITVKYSYGDSKNGKKWDITSVRNISETGMCITTQEQFLPNDIVTFLVKIPSRPLDWIEFTGRVVASEKIMATSGQSIAALHLTRVEFINLQEDQKVLVREYVAWFLNKEEGEKR